MAHKNNPKISIIIPVYNAEKYLRECLDSVINQTLKEIEILCINDGSTDTSLDILNEYAKKDNRIKIFSQKNAGPATARNVGLNNAFGTFCIFLDADDYFNPQMLEKLYNQITKTTSDICFCNYNIKHTQSIIWSSKIPALKNPFSPENVVDKIFQTTHPVPWNKLYKTEFIKKNKLKFLNQPSCNDLSFTYSSFILAEKISYIEDVLITYRIDNPSSITKITENKIANVFNAYDELFKIINLQKNTEAYFQSFYKSLNETLAYYLSDAKNKLVYPSKCHFIKNKQFEQFLISQKKLHNIINACLYQTPLISIIIPVYNAEAYIKQTPNSLLSQTQNNIEIICIDDGSKDNSWNILQEYAKKDKRIKAFTQKNAGPAQARNKGLSIAQGVYLMFCDADDWYENNMCQEMLSHMILNKVDFAMCDANIIEENAKHHRSKSTIEYHHLKISGLLQLNEYNKQAISVLLWNKIFKMDIIKKYNFTFPNGFECDDNAFIYQYLSVAQNTYGIQKKLYNYRLLSNSIMGKVYSKKNLYRVYDIIDVFKHCITNLQKNNLFQEKNWLLRIIITQIGWALSLFNKKEKYKFLEILNNKVLCLFTQSELQPFPVLFECSNHKYSKVIKRLKQSKQIKFLGITVLSKKEKRNTTTYYMLNIPIFKKKQNHFEKKYYLLGIKIFSKSTSIYNYLDYKFDQLSKNLLNKTLYLDKEINQIIQILENKNII